MTVPTPPKAPQERPPKPTFVLIPGAGGSAWFWHPLVAELQRRGYGAIAVQLPAGDDSAGLAEYTRIVVDAAAGIDRPVLVAQSLGGFTAPLVCAQIDVRLLVLVNAMVPKPGESAGDWWEATGQREARVKFAAEQGRTATGTGGSEFDPLVEFFHDVPPELTAEAMAQEEPAQSDTPFGPPWPLERWPDVPTRFLQGRDDRLFPIDFQRRIVRERLGVEIDEMPGGHLLPLSQPFELANRLEGYLAAGL
jgi:pimeloyl-ACP methyl ester carboxylesterase